MNWDEVPLQVLRDLWAAKYGDEMSMEEVNTKVDEEPIWGKLHYKLACALQFEWVPGSSQTRFRLKSGPNKE